MLMSPESVRERKVTPRLLRQHVRGRGSCGTRYRRSVSHGRSVSLEAEEEAEHVGMWRRNGGIRTCELRPRRSAGP